MSSPWLLLQLADSAFPTGGFAHSAGLEASHQLGETVDQQTLSAFLELGLCQLALGALPYVSGGYLSVTETSDPMAIWPGLGRIDRHLDAFLINHVANRASRALGRGLITTAAAAFATTHPRLNILETKQRDDAWPGHLATMWGGVCALLEIAPEDGHRLFVFQHLRSSLSAAVRLGIVGPRSAQSLQHKLADAAEAAVLSAKYIPYQQAAQCAPLQELFQGHHDRLYSRLFSS